MPAFPPGVHRIGGANAAPVNRELAREFYQDILPRVVELRAAGLSLRAIAAELDRQGVRPRCDYPGQKWSAEQVRLLLKRVWAGAVVKEDEPEAVPAVKEPEPEPVRVMMEPTAVEPAAAEADDPFFFLSCLE